MQEMFCPGGSRIDHRRDSRPERMMISDNTESLRLTGVISVDMYVDQSGGNIHIGRIDNRRGKSGIDFRGNTRYSGTRKGNVHHPVNLIPGVNDVAALEQNVIFLFH